MASGQGAGCLCRVPLDEVAMPGFARGQDQYAWLEANGVTDIGPDHLSRISIPVADAMRLRRESDALSEVAMREAATAREAHAQAVADLREDIAAAFLEMTGGAAVASP